MLPSMFHDHEADGIAAYAVSLADVSPVGFATMTRASAEADLRDALGRIDVPTLVLCAGHDVRSPVHVGEALHRAIPGSRLVVLPNVGHVSAVETPMAFNRAVRDFLGSIDEMTQPT